MVSASLNSWNDAGRDEFDIDRLEGVAAVVGGLEHAGVGPDLGFGGAAAGGEDPHDGPFAAARRAACRRAPGRRTALAAPTPTMTSFLPHSNMRPSTSLSLSRTLSAARSTPRIGTLASVPVERLGRLMMTNSSAEASGPSSVRATPGASAMMRVLSRRKPLTISLSAPLRRTMAASGEPEAVRALRKPTPIESTPTRTATTPAMPKTAAATEPRRCGMLSKPNLLTAATCESQLMGPDIGKSEGRSPKSEGRVGHG